MIIINTVLKEIRCKIMHPAWQKSSRVQKECKLYFSELPIKNIYNQIIRGGLSYKSGQWLPLDERGNTTLEWMHGFS